MKTKNFDLRIFLTLALFLMVIVGFAQNKPETKAYLIETKDGNSYTGQIVTSDSVKVIFNAGKLGEITLQQSDIKKMEPLNAKQLKGNKYWFDNPQSTRYFFSPNGYGLKKGEGYYQNIWVLMNSFAVGINDYISVGGGLVPLFLFGGAPTPVWITAKVSVPVTKDKFNVGAGILAATALGESSGGIGIFYGIATLGSRDKNVSLGIGYGFSGGSVSNTPILNLNGMLRVGARSYLLSENYFFTDGSSGAGIIMIGGRQIIKNAGLDYGLMMPVGTGVGSFVAAPWLGITVAFGKRKM
ncbi:MAG: hypothetical protein M1292_08335 [Bacteroidetes bacterium]|nr:hypothetical protein [Bacteroidota bacterium]